jgi:hypothetical protein
LRGNPEKYSKNGVVSATQALDGIAQSPDGALAVVDADVFAALPSQLKSIRVSIRESTVDLLGTLASQEFGLNLILNSNLLSQLVSLLRRVLLPMLELDHNDFHQWPPPCGRQCGTYAK